MTNSKLPFDRWKISLSALPSSKKVLTRLASGEWREARKTVEQAVRLSHVILNFKAALNPGAMPDIDTIVTKKDLPS